MKTRSKAETKKQTKTKKKGESLPRFSSKKCVCPKCGANGGEFVSKFVIVSQRRTKFVFRCINPSCNGQKGSYMAGHGES